MNKLPLYFSAFLALAFFITLPAVGFFYFMPDNSNSNQAVLGTKVLQVNGVEVEESTQTIFKIKLILEPKTEKQVELSKFLNKKVAVLKGKNIIAKIENKTLSIYNLDENEQIVELIVY